LDRTTLHSEGKQRQSARTILAGQLPNAQVASMRGTIYGSVISGGGQVTPTTDTNGLGHCDAGTDACGASSEASDSAGHFGRALQAEVHLTVDQACPQPNLQVLCGTPRSL
jgi:hypothetical protein